MKIKEWRIKNNLTQMKFAQQFTKRTGLNLMQRTLSSWEANNVKPRERFIQAIKKITKNEVTENDFV